MLGFVFKVCIPSAVREIVHDAMDMMEEVFDQHNQRTAIGCCDAYSLLDFSKMELPDWLSGSSGPRIDWADRDLAISAAVIIFNPFFWNCLIRLEYSTKVISNLCGGPRMGCFFFGVAIIFLGAVRIRSFQLAVHDQPIWEGLQIPIVHYIGAALIVLGLIFAFSSFFALGFYGTYYGDYFGIEMDHRVTSFPFNVMNNPMYWGTVMDFLGYSLWYGPNPAGIVLSLLLGVCYKTALVFEGPFTASIFAKRSEGTENKKYR